MNKLSCVGFFLLFSLVCSSCAVTKFDILFNLEDGINDNPVFQQMKIEAEKNYVIERFDEISFRLFTNKGELLIDPDGELRLEGQFELMMNRNNGNNVNTSALRYQNQSYTVQDDGKVYLPLVGGLEVEGRKIYQLDSLISVAYQQYYENSYARTQIANRRVVVMGALGNRIITLPYESMSLTEVLVMAGGNLDRSTRNDKIRVIRNVLSDQPIIQSIDLSTWQGVKNANMQVRPNDVIYVEPRRRKIQQAAEEVRSVTRIFAEITGFITSAITLWVVLQTNKNSGG